MSFLHFLSIFLLFAYRLSDGLPGGAVGTRFIASGVVPPANSQGQMQNLQNQIDDLNAEEGNDNSTQAID